MRKEKRDSLFKISYITVLLFVIIGILVWYSYVLKEELGKEVRGTIEEITRQNKIIVQKEIAADLNILTEISERIVSSGEQDGRKIAKVIDELTKRYSFMRAGYCNKEGIAYTFDEREVDRSKREWFQNSMKGERSISDPLYDEIVGENCIVFSVPVNRENGTDGVIFATYSLEILKDVIGVSFFNGEGYAYIVKPNGKVVADSANPTSFQNVENIYEAMEEADEKNKEPVRQLELLMNKGENDYVIFYNKVAKYMYAAPLGINDWYLIDVVPVNVMEETTNYIMVRTYMLCAIVVIVYTFILILIMRNEQKKKEEIQNLLYVDKLTKGNSHTKFRQEVEKRMRLHYGHAAFIIADITEFKLVNELFGYDEGNRILCSIWEILQEECRDNETTARRVADRFSIFWYYENRKEIEDRILKVSDKIQQIQVGSATDYILHPAFGIYYVEKRDEEIADMLNCATLALNRVKTESGKVYSIYSNKLKQEILRKKQLSDQMEYAYLHHEFEVYYQPKYNSWTKELAGAEALVRWKKPDGKIISPGEFIPLAEESGFVCKLDKYIFHEVCVAQEHWRKEGRKIVPVSVNLSRRHLDNPVFIEEYKQIIDETGVPIDMVQIEVTESAMFEKQGEFLEIIERLHKLGFEILMDDFGTGYSSLMMLKQIPIDVMKLDKSFVDDYDDERGEQIIRCVMQMAQNLNIKITAEGVETEEQYEFLRDIGCDLIQGFYFARPMPQINYESCMER